MTTLFIAIFSAALANASPTSLVQTFPAEVSSLEVINLKPIAGHHFNIEAPQKCAQGNPVLKTTRKVQCQFEGAGEKTMLVSVCDDPNTFCKQEKLKVVVNSAAEPTAKRLQPISDDGQKASAKLMENSGFKVATYEDVQAEAAKSGKYVIALISTQWCPTCNDLKEMLFPKEAFQNLLKDYIAVYVDGDSIYGTTWGQKYLNAYYPSMLLLDPNMNELDRFVGYIPVPEFQTWLEKTKLEGPMSETQKRSEQRRKGAIAQKMMDFFKSKDQMESETLRLARWMMRVNKTEDARKILKGLKSKEAKLAYADATADELSSKTAEEMSAEDKKEFVSAYKLAFSNNSDWVSSYYYPLFCSVDKKGCEEFAATAVDAIEKGSKKPNLDPAEQLYFQAYAAGDKGNILSAVEKKAEAKTQFAICADLAGKLASQISQKTARGINQKRMGCLAKLDKPMEAEKLVRELIKTYPYESTFYRSLAMSLRDQKKFKEAFEAASKAEAYGYGSNWARAATLKAELALELGKVDEAKKMVATLLEEVNPTNDPNSWQQSVLSKVRDYQEKMSQPTDPATSTKPTN